MPDPFEDYPHIKFEKSSINVRTQLRKTGGPRGQKTQDPTIHGETLSEELDEIQKNKDDLKLEYYPPDLEPSLIFTIEQEETPESTDELKKYFRVPDDDIINSNLEILDRENDENIIVFSSDEELSLFRENLEKYTSERTTQGNPRYSTLFSNIKSLEPLKPEQRFGKKLRSLINFPDFSATLYDIRIDFWWLGREKTQEIVTHCIDIIQNNNGSVTNSYAKYGVASIISHISGSTVDILSKIIEVSKIELISEQPIQTNFIEFTKKDLPEKKMTNLDNLPLICLIDTGVTEKHPILEGIVDSENSLLKTSKSAIKSDEDGHGTHLTGNLIYNNLEQQLENSEIVPDARLISVKIAKQAVQKYTSDFNDKVIEGIEEVFQILVARSLF